MWYLEIGCILGAFIMLMGVCLYIYNFIEEETSIIDIGNLLGPHHHIIDNDDRGMGLTLILLIAAASIIAWLPFIIISPIVGFTFYLRSFRRTQKKVILNEKIQSRS